MARLVQRAACAWLRYRYGGSVYSLRPPLGFHPIFSPRPWWWVALYRVRRMVWSLENAAFERWGQAMRDEWEKRLLPPNATRSATPNPEANHGS